MNKALDKIRKAFKLALDPATPAAEQQAAWTGALRLCIAQGWTTFDQVLGAFGSPVTPTKDFFKQTGDEPYGWDQVMQFGKHSGLTLGEIARENPDYIEWLHGAELRSGQLRRAVNSVHEWLENQ